MSRERSNKAKFAGTAVPFMIEQMCARGAIKSRLRAKLAGGAAMFASLQPAPALQMGERNIQAARAALERAGVPILAQDVGGDFGRSIFFRVEDGVMLIKSVRRGDISV
jgi:chemotaxis protein CheD